MKLRSSFSFLRYVPSARRCHNRTSEGRSACPATVAGGRSQWYPVPRLLRLPPIVSDFDVSVAFGHAEERLEHSVARAALRRQRSSAADRSDRPPRRVKRDQLTAASSSSTMSG